MFVCKCLVLSVFSSDMFHIQMQSSRKWIDEMKWICMYVSECHGIQNVWSLSSLHWRGNLCAVLPALFSTYLLTLIISICCQIFLPACLPLWEGLCWACILYCCSSKFCFQLGVLKHFSASVTVQQGSCWCCQEFGVVCVWLIKF